MLNKIIPIPYITTLDQMYEDFNELLHCFVTFRIQTEQEIICNVTIPYCRFREAHENAGLLDVRSCDCEGTLCNHPTQRIFMSKSQLKNYVFFEENNFHYIFVYRLQ